MLKKRRFYTLQDIKKHIVYTPLIFIFFIAIISIFVIGFIQNFQKNNEIKLYKQKNEFIKKDILDKYILDVKFNASASFDKNEKVLNNSVISIVGLIENSPAILSLEYVKEKIKEIEEQNNLDFVIFDKIDYKVLYGQKSIDYLQIMTDSKIESKKFKHHMLKSIAYVSDDDLIYWIDNQKRKIRLSYFKNIKINRWFIGAFSRIDDMKLLTKDSILNSIEQKGKYYENSHFWFYDYGSKTVYNYFNKAQNLTVKEVLSKDNSSYANKILVNYINNEKKLDDVYDFNKYNFLVAIKSYDVEKEIEKLDNKYTKDFNIAVSIVVLFSMLLIIASTIFSKFINTIFYRYNKRLETKNKMYKKWKDRYELAIIASNDGLWDIDLETNEIYFSKQWLNMFGYERSEIKNLNGWLNLIHPEDKNAVEKKLQKHFKGDSSHFICEYRIRDKKNRYKWILVRGKVFEDENSSKRRMLMMSMDIQERKRLVKELQYVDLLVEYGRIVIFKWKNDLNLTLDYVSKSINSYGYSVEEFETQKIKYFDFVYKDDIPELLNQIKIAIKNKEKSFTHIYRVKDKNSSLRWVFNRTIFLKDDFGNITHLYGYINDITQMKINEQELKNKIKQEVSKNIEKDRLIIHQSKLAAMGEMLGSIAHQWRQPLNNINLLTYLIRDNFDNFTKEDIKSTTADITRQINYMSQTIDDFRNFYQPDKDKVKFDIKEAFESSAIIASTQFEKNDISIDIQGDDVEIVSFKNEFQQVILNIFNNAIDAAILKKSKEDFKPLIEVKIKKENKIVITLSNNCGKATNEVLDRMFEPYFTTKFENQGTGIGLYMAKTIIEKNMNGSIDAQNYGDGVIFTINLPL
jgi:PAS domain S-box-containing protein